MRGIRGQMGSFGFDINQPVAVEQTESRYGR
jgi:hypothetical protein